MQKNGILYKAGQSLTMKGVIGLVLFGIIELLLLLIGAIAFVFNV